MRTILGKLDDTLHGRSPFRTETCVNLIVEEHLTKSYREGMLPMLEIIAINHVSMTVTDIGRRLLYVHWLARSPYQ